MIKIDVKLHCKLPFLGLQGAVRGIGGPGMASMQPGYGAPMPPGGRPY